MRKELKIIMITPDLKRYTFYVDEKAKRVVALSTFAQKPVRGIAKCDPRDEFSTSDGMLLAAARCNARIAKKRKRNADARFEEAARVLAQAKRNYEKMKQYSIDADSRLAQAEAELEEIETSYSGD